MNWEALIFVFIILAWIIAAQIHNSSPEAAIERAATFDNAARIAAEDVCDSVQWSNYPDQCESMAKEEKTKQDKKFSIYQ